MKDRASHYPEKSTVMSLAIEIFEFNIISPVSFCTKFVTVIPHITFNCQKELA